MTDRFKGCTVVFERDIRDDDAEGLLDAILRLRGVSEVNPSLSTADDYMNRSRMERKAREQIFEFYKKFQISP